MTEKTPDWVWRAWEALIEADKAMPLPDSLKAENPNWETRTATNLLNAACPTLQLGEQAQTLTAQAFGRAIGYLKVLTEKALAAELAIDLEKFSPEELQSLEEIGAEIEDAFAKRDAVYEEAVRSAMNAPEDERTDFFSGLTEAFAVLGNPIQARDNTHVLLVMFLFQRKVNQFTKLDEFHAWLETLLGSNRTGSKKRIEKICQRIGKSFGRRGRPKGKKGGT